MKIVRNVIARDSGRTTMCASNSFCVFGPKTIVSIFTPKTLASLQIPFRRNFLAHFSKPTSRFFGISFGKIFKNFSFRENVLIFACLVLYFQDFQLTSQSLRMRSIGNLLYHVVWYGVASATFTFIFCTQLLAIGVHLP